MGIYDNAEQIAVERPLREIADGFSFFKHDELGVVIDFYHPQFIGHGARRLIDMLHSNLAYHFPDRFGQSV